MSKEEVLERLLHSYERYYTIDRETPTEPFAAEAVFAVHGEQYFLIKAAKMYEMDASEYVFYAVEGDLTKERYEELEEIAWKTGTGRVVPRSGHRNSDVILFVIADSIEPEAAKRIRKANRYQSYRLSFWGWSALKVVAYEISGEKKVSNYRGRALEKLLA